MPICFGRSRYALPACCAWWIVRVLTLNYPEAVRCRAGIVVSEYLLQLAYHPIFELGALVAVQGFSCAENADYSFNDGLGYCFGCFMTC